MSLQGLVCTLLPFLGALPVSMITRKNAAWYEHIKKPSWMPPKWALAPVWTCLYAGMGYASHLVYQEGADTTALLLYGSQLALNWAWTPLFFGLHKVKLASLEISALWLSVAACGLKFFSINKTAGLLFLPYLAWVSLATALTFNVWRNNGDRPQQTEQAVTKEK